MKDRGQCVQCGYCCTVAPCAAGKPISTTNPRCLYLSAQNTCGIYQSIRHDTMFGSGCSSRMFNDVRNRKLKELEDPWHSHNATDAT